MSSQEPQPSGSQNPTSQSRRDANPNVESEESDTNPMSRQTSLGSQIQLLTTMPSPGAANAPYFTGSRATVFLEALKRICDGAGLNEDESVNQIYFYSSISVQDTIRYNASFNIDKKKKTWEAAKKSFLRLYGSSDLAPAVTITDLQNFTMKQNSKTPFLTRSAIEHYYQAFERLSGVLICNRTITEADARYYFVSGLPQPQREWLENQLENERKSRETAPSIDEVLDLLYTRFDPKHLFYDPWKAIRFPDPDRVQFDDEGERKERFKADNKKVDARPTGQGVPSTSIDDLAAQLEALKINQAQVMSLLSSVQNSPIPQSTSSGSQPRPTTGLYESKRCFVCGKEGPQLTHKLHPAHCPETKSLVDEGLVRWDENLMKYTLINGKDLPKVARTQQGGVAAFIREHPAIARSESANEKQRQVRFERDAPPHQTPSRTSNLDLYIDGHPAFTNEVFDSSNAEYNTYPVDRTGRDSSTRYDPLARRDPHSNKGKDQARPNRPLQGPGVPGPSTSQPQPSSAPPPKPKEKNIEILPPTNPINRRDGWKESVPSKSKTQKDVKMNEPKSDKPSYHFTSDVQQKADSKAIYEHIMSQMVSLPILQVIGSSPSLQKLFSEATKSRREYLNTKSAEFLPYDNFDDSYSLEDTEYTGNIVHLHLTERDLRNDRYKVDDLVIGAEDASMVRAFLARASTAILKEPSKKFFAMVTGTLDVQINGVTFSAMIDTGSELNVASVDVPDRASLAVDFEGMNWSLKGIHGRPEQLHGVVIDAPMKLGRHEFPHHIFVSHQKMDKQDIILGQPFLTTYSARIQYHQTGLVNLLLWKDPEDGKRATLTINLTQANDPRNKTTIGCPRHSQSARVEEYDSDEQNF
ncbi:hypothetical protein E1B28_012922 [Marasmius oreades]|uniref:DUF4100 domain-containing protein n=1 Tax=Marasmius oreades TaxID=181124 RepID=A0A9P7RSI1_9AGAR|nr:uncharacterized protein E1B28_012922 [Marasmius oreades]KAG7088976.1 hypothetical protein E1B28_012922 [Marasmius oreades]